MNFDIGGLWDAKDADSLFQSILILLISVAFAFRTPELSQWALQQINKSDNTERKRPISIDRLETRFLSVFWLLRTSFWMSGPYFYSACASKMHNGSPLSVSTISKIALVGYMSTPVFGPLAGGFLSRKGPKVGSIMAAIFYCIGALSMCSESLPILFLGRAFGGFGSSLMSSAPEAWLVTEVKSKDKYSSGVWLRAIFERAFQFDPILAIFAGKLAGVFASYRGPTGPFQAQPLILGAAIGMILLLWSGSNAKEDKETKQEDKRETLRSVLTGEVMKKPSICLVGCIQIFFESSMNIFVMLWPPTMNAAIKSVYGASSITPFGTIFSCMMASCMVGGLFFGQVTDMVGFNLSMILVMLSATLSMCLAAFTVANFDPETDGTTHLIQLTTAFMVFEACVGAYFPSIGVLRCSNFGDGKLQLLLTLFQLPTNATVAVVFVSLQSLGNTRALMLTCALLGLATLSMILLRFEDERLRRKEAVDKLKKTVRKMMFLQSFNSEADEVRGHHKRGHHRRGGHHRRLSSLHEYGQDGLQTRGSFGSGFF